MHMRRLLIFIIIACVTTISAAAIHVPDSDISENRNGRQLIIMTFTLSPDDDPGELILDDFEREGYLYSTISIVKEEHPFESRRTLSETVTVETATNDLGVILGELAAAIQYDDGEYSGVLALDHTSLRTEVTGYSTRSSTVSTTRRIEGLDRNDPSFVPRTTVHNGVTLSLQNVEWAVQSSALSGDALVPTQFMAIATYSANTSRRVADGYTTTATYSGEVVSSGIASIVYTVTYIGEPIVIPEPEPELPEKPEQSRIVGFVISAIAIPVLLAAGTAAYLLLKKDTKVYAQTDNGDEYEMVGKLRLNTSNPIIDFRVMSRYPSETAAIEIKHATARRMFGRQVKVRLRDTVASHMIEQAGSGDYMFTVSTSTTDQEDSE